MGYKNKEEAKAYREAYYEAHREEWKEANRQYRLNHKESVRDYQKDYRGRHREKIKQYHKDYHLKRQYGITFLDKLEMLRNQNNECPLCGWEIPTENRAVVDHDHDTGEVRGLLCPRCNIRLGWYEGFQQQITDYLHKTEVWEGGAGI